MNSNTCQFVLGCYFVWVVTALGAAAPAQASKAIVHDADMIDNVPMAHYLIQLAQVAPIAREAAELYLHTYRIRCGRALTALELRRAVRANDRLLMGMLTRMSQGDGVGARSLASEIACRGK